MNVDLIPIFSRNSQAFSLLGQGQLALIFEICTKRDLLM
jgi:hypothetical protein